MRKKKSEKSGIANSAERLCDKHGHNNDDAMTRRTGKRTENAKIPRTRRLFFESRNTSCEQKRKTSSGDAAPWNLLLSFLSLFRLPANTASLFSPTVATANTTGQQCGPVRIARVRPLIPRVSFFRPRSVLLLPSHTLPSPPLFCLYAPSFPSLLIPAPSFSRSSRRSPFGQDLDQPSQWPSLELDFRKDFLRPPSHLLGTLPCVAFTKYDESYGSRKEVEKTRFVFDRTPPG